MTADRQGFEVIHNMLSRTPPCYPAFLQYKHVRRQLFGRLTYIHNAYTLGYADYVGRAEAQAQPEGARPRLRGCSAGVQQSHVTYEDDRFRYEEQRFVTLGLFEGIPVSIVHTETKDRIHIISFRKATKRETAILFENL